MESTDNNQVDGTVTESQEKRTFTQDEVNQIVADRLKRESAKYADYEQLKTKASKFDENEEAKKTELQKANEKTAELQRQLDAMNQEKAQRDIREKVAKETGVPASLLTGTTEEICKEQAEAILEFKGEKQSYPSVKDGGDPNKVQTKSAKDDFAEWFKQFN